MAGESLLDELGTQTKVDCDTLDASVPQTLGPFEDCTSNQAIALGELKKPENGDVIRAAAQHATKVSQKQL